MKKVKSLLALVMSMALVCTVAPAASISVSAVEAPMLSASYVRFADVAAEETNYATQKPWLTTYGYAGDGQSGMSLGTRLPAIAKTLISTAAETRMKAVTAISNDGTSPADALFCLAYYENGMLKDIDYKQVTVDAGTEKSVSAEITTAAQLSENVMVKAFAWDKQLNPLIPATSYPSSNADLKTILIDGVPLVGFTPETTVYEIPIQPVAPIIKGITADSGAKAVTEVDYLNKNVKITVTASVGATKVYNINVVSNAAPFAVTNYQQLYTGSPTGSKTGRIIPQGFTTADQAGLAYTDENWRTIRLTNNPTPPTLPKFIPGILGERVGYPAIIPARTWKDDPYYNTAWMSDPLTGGNGRDYVDWFSFDINKTADVMIIAANRSLPNWVRTNDWKEDLTGLGWKVDPGIYDNYLTVSGVAGTYCAAIKRFTVGEGSLTVTMKSPGMQRNEGTGILHDVGVAAEPYWVIVRPVADTNSGFAEPIGNITPLAKTVTVDNTTGSPVFTKTATGIAMPQLSIQKKFGEGAYPYFNLTPTTQGVQYQFINDIAGEYMLEGSYFIQEQSLGTAGRMADDAAIAYQAIQDWYSFDIYKSADVFAFMEGKNNNAEAGASVDNAPGFVQYGWKELPLPDATVMDGELTKQWFMRKQLWNGPPQANNYIKCYKMSVDVTDGQETVVIPTKGAVVGNGTDAAQARQNWNMVIVVRFK